MRASFSRRSMLQLTAFAPALQPLWAQSTPAPPPKSVVSLVKGQSRRKNVTAVLVAIDAQIQPVLKTKKYVVVKVNNVSTTNQLASSHVDTIHGILDYLAPRFPGQVVVAESSAGDTLEGYEEFGYSAAVKEHRAQNVKLVDLNREAKYKTIPLIDYDLHVVPTRLAARLFDPDAFVICACMCKTHNVVVASLSIKNMALGAPLHSAPGDSRWNDKRKAHNGLRQTHYNIFLAAQAMKPYFGAAVIDAYEGMEGNGPNSGNPVPARLAIASTDFISADRVAIETMGINPDWPGYLRFCSDFGIGQYDLKNIEVRGERIETVRRKYLLHPDIERQLEWMGPMKDLPSRLG